MARVHGKDFTTVSVDDSGGTPVAMVSDTMSIEFTTSAETHDTTTIGDDWREFTAGLKGGDELSHSFMYDNTSTTGIWEIYRNRLGVAGTLTISDGVRTLAMETIVTKLSLPVQVGDMVKCSASHKVTGAVTFS